MVRLAAGRHDQVRREPAEEVRGHRQRRLLRRGRFPALWHALRDVVLFWVDAGRAASSASTTRTPSRFPFWEWLIAEVRGRHPDAIFLAEAFTRPKMMKRLAKIGFSQSYTYFTWRNTKAGADRVSDRADARRTPRDYIRPNFFVNTPDINPVFLQTSGRAGFLIRAVLAATPRRHYGASISGFELCEAAPLPGKEEYLDSREVRDPGLGLGPARQHPRRHPRAQPAPPRATRRCRTSPTLTFYNAWNDQVLFYGKTTPDRRRLHPRRRQPRPAQRAGRRLRGAALGVRPARRRRARGRGPDARQPLHLARQDPARCGSTRTSRPFAIWRLCRRRSAPTDECTPRRPDPTPGSHVREPTPIDRIRVWYKDAVIYQLHVKSFFDSNNDGIGDFPGLIAAARLHRGARRQRDLAAAVLSLAAARRRLRHRRLPRRQPGLRHAARLHAPSSPRRTSAACASSPSWSSTTPPTSTPGSSARARAKPGSPRARLLRLVRHRPELSASTRIIFLDTEKSNWTWDPVAKAYFWHRFYCAPARPQLRQPARARGGAAASCTSGSTWASTGCGSTPSPIWSSATAPTTRTCPRPTPS